MKSVLIVDDMAIIREPLAAALAQRGYEVRCASDGVEAIRRLRNQPPTLVLLDVGMPHADGVEVLKKMRSDPAMAQIPVIMLTDSNDRDTVLRAKNLGVAGYVLKSSFSLERILAVIEEAIGGAKERGQPEGTRDSIGSRPRQSEAATAAESLGALKPLMTRSGLIERLKAFGDVRSFPPVIHEVVRMSQSSEASIEAMTQLIRRDQGLAVRMLKLANSAAYARGRSAESIDQAVVRIGLQGIGQAALGLDIVDQFSRSGGDANPAIDVRAFWEHSIACGLIASRLAVHVEGVSPDVAFTAGLLHDVGRLALVEIAPDEYRAVLETAAQLGVPLEDAETRLLSMNHAECMTHVLRAWGIPREIIEPIVHHHQPTRAGSPKAQASHVAVLQLADRLAHAMLLGSSGNDVIYASEECCRQLRIPAGIIADIEAHIADETENLKLNMISAGIDGQWPDMAAAVRAQGTGPVRPVYVSAEPEIDACRMFCARIADQSSEPPNLLVVYIEHASEQAIVSEMCRAEGDGGLPMLVLSPGGGAMPVGDVTADRRVASLATPFVTGRFMCIINELLTDRRAAAA